MSSAATMDRLRALLEAADFQVTERSEGWVASRGRDRRVLVLLRDVRAPHDVEGAFPPDAIYRAVVYPEDPGAVARGLAAELGIELFDTDSIGSALGEILLGDHAHGGSGSVPPADGLPLEVPMVVIPDGERTVAPRVDLEEAARIVDDPSLRPTLRWVPYYVAPYRVRVASPHGNPGRTDEHLVAVNALQRHAEPWERGAYELTAAAEVTARLAPEIERGAAEEVALEWIRRHHTIRVDHTEQHGGTVVMETRRIPPRPDDVRLGPMALVHVPFYYFEGARGRVVINAATGRAYSPADDPR
ncbi:MAG: hypothetical protein ACREB9_02260 [Thermoplasmata archaeon]